MDRRARDKVNPVYRHVLKRLRLHCGIPIRLPGYTEVFPNLRVSASCAKSWYSVVLTIGPDCGDAEACHYGSILGARGRVGARWPGDRRIRLGRHTFAWYQPTHFYSFYTDAVLRWQQGPFNYELAEKGADTREMLRMARSMVASTPIEPLHRFRGSSTGRPPPG